MPPSSGGHAEADEPGPPGRPRLLSRFRRMPPALSWRLTRWRVRPYPPRQPSRARKAEAILAVFGLLAGFGVTLAGLSSLRATHGHAPAGPSPPPAEAAPAAIPSPAALDAEWARYADHSTCADWAGADGVSAVPIGHSQLAWFFSDTDLGPVAPDTGFKTISGFIHNSVVVQTTQRGTTRFVTLTGGGTCTAPGGASRYAASVVPAAMAGLPPSWRFWNGDGLTVGGSILRFYNGFTPGPPPFLPVANVIARFSINDLRSAAAGSPAGGGVARPQLTVLPAYTPAPGGTPIAWGSAVLRDGGTVYIYGWASPDRSEAVKQLYLARAPLSHLTDPAAWRYFSGGGDWAPGVANARPVQPSGADFNISTGFSVLRLAGRYWLIQQDSATGSPDIVAFPSSAPWGPFDPGAGILLYRSPDVGLDAAHDFRIMYEARAEPALSTSRNLMISYNVNSVGVTTGCQPLSAFTDTIIRPRFISIPMALFSGRPGARFAVHSGPSPYTDVTNKNPSQWFNGWAYRGGCPPVPALSDVSAQSLGNGAVALRWPGAGLGLAYRVYRRELGSGYRPSYGLVSTVSGDGTTVSGLRRGGTYQFLVVPVNAKRKTGGGAAATITAY